MTSRLRITSRSNPISLDHLNWTRSCQSKGQYAIFKLWISPDLDYFDHDCIKPASAAPNNRPSFGAFRRSEQTKPKCTTMQSCKFTFNAIFWKGCITVSWFVTDRITNLAPLSCLYLAQPIYELRQKIQFSVSGPETLVQGLSNLTFNVFHQLFKSWLSILQKSKEEQHSSRRLTIFVIFSRKLINR